MEFHACCHTVQSTARQTSYNSSSSVCILLLLLITCKEYMWFGFAHARFTAKSSDTAACTSRKVPAKVGLAANSLLSTSCLTCWKFFLLTPCRHATHAKTFYLGVTDLGTPSTLLPSVIACSFHCVHSAYQLTHSLQQPLSLTNILL